MSSPSVTSLDRQWTRALIPLWPPCLLAAGAAGFSFWHDRRRARPGHCRCGYDLTGNTSGLCPECGTAVLNGHQRRPLEAWSQFEYEQIPPVKRKLVREPRIRIVEDGEWHAWDDSLRAFYRVTADGLMQSVHFDARIAEPGDRQFLETLKSCGPLRVPGHVELRVRRSSGRFDMWSHWVWQADGVEFAAFTADEWNETYRRLVKLEDQFHPPECRSCGYDLTGNTSGVCPECGERI